MRKTVAVLTLVVMLVLSGDVMAQEEDATAQKKVTSFGVGGHIGWPTLIGPSLKVWVSPRIGLQGMGSRFSAGDFSLTMLSGRFLYKLTTREGKVFPYLGVGVGTWIASGTELEWDSQSGWSDKKITESVPTFEAILGLQHKYAENFYGDYEFGYYAVNFDEADVTVSGMALSWAIHYFF